MFLISALTTEFLSFLSLVLVAFSLIFFITRNARRRNGFPQPFGLPLVGHAFFLGPRPVQTFLQWQNKLGPVFEIRYWSKRIIVLNDHKSIMEAFSKPEFSGRVAAFPIIKFIGAKVGEGLSFHEGPEAEQLRKFFMTTFGKSHFLTSLEASIQEEMCLFLNELKARENQPIELYMAFIPLLNCLWKAFASDRFSNEENDVANQLIADTLGFSTATKLFAMFNPQLLAVVNQGAVDFKVNAWHKLADILDKKCVESHRLSLQTGEFDDLFALLFDRLEDAEGKTAFPAKEKAVSIVMDLLVGILDGYAPFMEWFVYYSTRFPDHQKKLQEEIDRVIGTRVPSFADKPQMPYTSASILETFRVGQPAFGIPHSTTSDTYLRGVWIPKGTMVLGNLFALHRNPKVWPDPERFDPTRFLTEDGTFIPRTGIGRPLTPFGIGKRSCLAATFNERVVFMFVVHLYQRFSVHPLSKPEDVDCSMDFVVRLKPGFKVAVRERSGIVS